jgi:hypothetical protein
MPSIRLSAFQGEQPQLIPTLLPETGAQSARDVRLDDGGLTPTKTSVQTGVASSATHLTIYKHAGVWRSWPTIVNAAPGPVAADRLYFTGDSVPKVAIAGTDWPLAVPAATPALTAVLGGVGAGDVITRVYTWTWVTAFGEESEPAPASNALNWQPGNTVTLSGFPATPAGRNITLQRIYRSQTGQSGTGFYLIAERAATNANFSDTIAVDAFQEPLPSTNWTAPPAGLIGLVGLQNGMMAAFVGKQLYFCEPFQPHAWPQIYVLTLDYDIVALGSIGASVVVLTTATPYFVTGNHPSTMQPFKIERNRPCINARGVVDLGYAIAYPSHDGLYLVQGDGSIDLVTGKLFDRDKWLQLSPSTFISSQHLGRYVAFYDSFDENNGRITGAIIIDIGVPFLTRTAERASAAFYDKLGSALCYLRPGTDPNIFILDAVDGARQTLYWRSKLFRMQFETNFGALLIDADPTIAPVDTAIEAAIKAAIIVANNALIAAGSIGGELNGAAVDVYTVNGDALAVLPGVSNVILSVGVYADGNKVAEISKHNGVQRLPSGFLAREWEIECVTNVPVTQICMATTVDELKQIG